MKKRDPSTTTRAAEDLEARLIRLSRQNAVLRREIQRLQVYRAMAYRDPLTGLWNRRYFEERLREEFSRSQRAGRGRRFSVLVIDIDGFKDINDEYGHQTGDAVLKLVGEFLTSRLRSHDVPCRTGGDEFMVLLPDLSAEDSGRLIARLRDQLDAVNATREIPVSLSVGAASWPEVGGSCEELLARADEAMYAEKRSQRAVRERSRTPAVGRRGRAPASLG